MPPLHPLQMRSDVIFLAHALLRFQHRDFVVASVAFHPPSVFQGSLGQDLRGDRILTVHVAEKVNNMLGPRQQGQVALDDDAVETVIYKNQEAFKKLREGFHRSPPRIFWSDNHNHPSWRPVESTEHILSALRCSPGISRAQPLAMFR